MSMHHEHVHEEMPARHVVREEPDSLTSYAVVKYGFILLITISVLYFLAKFIIPLLR